MAAPPPFLIPSWRTRQRRNQHPHQQRRIRRPHLPAVLITDGSGDSTGIDATAFATITNGVLTGITITSPGKINYTVTPTVTLVGGDPAAAASLGTATIAQNTITGGLTKADGGTLILPGGYGYTNPGSTQAGSFVLANQLTTAQNTYGGATTVQGGTLEVETTYNATNSIIIQTTADSPCRFTDQSTGEPS